MVLLYLVQFHGTGGDLQIEKSEFTGIASVFTRAASEMDILQ